MACKRKRATAAHRHHLPRPPSSPPMKSLLFLAVHIVGGPSPRSVVAFSPPSCRRGSFRRLPSPSAHHVSSSASSWHSPKSRLSALPRSSPDATQTETEEPFFAQGFDGERIENYNADPSANGSNGSSGGMDAYAQQMQEFTQHDAAETSAQDRIQPPPYPPPPVQTESAASTSASSSSTDGDGISSVDARVLESILQEGKLDLSTEEEVKKLLEGPRLQEGDGARPRGDEDGKYSSKFVSAVSDNAFWNSLKAKANEIIESVGIYIENRIERDAQTLAAIGLFTLDRISRDIGRALPAAGRATRKLLLATNSSYAEKFLDVTDKTPFALPAERSVTDREMLGDWTDLYDELTTPADEIRQVTEAIRDILSGKEVGSYSETRRGVRSFAPAGTSRLAERQRRAYKARKKTVLKREREGIDRKVTRAIGSVTDATWEFRREMQTDRGREAGYRSKGVRRALAAGATQLLEAGRESSRRLLNGEKRQGMLGGDVGSVEIVDDDDAMPGILDVSPVEEEEIIEDVIEEANMEYAPDGLLSPQSFVEEKRRLITSLESCLSQPSETWLTQEVVAQATEIGVSLDGTVLREVITTMVTLRDVLQKEMEAIEAEQVDLKLEYVATELRRMKQMLDALCDVAISAAGESAALLLKQELEGFVLSDSLDDIIEIELERMEQLLAERVAAREREIQKRKERQRRKQRQVEQYRDTATAAAVATEVVERTIFGRARSAAQTFNSQFTDDVYTEVEVVSSVDSTSDGYAYGNTIDGQGQDYSKVELVSDTEYSEYEQQFKQAQSVDAIGEETEIEEENPAAEFVLRVVDVIFFIGEKFFLVLLPDLITGGARVTSRYAQAQNRGRGSVGWKPLRNARTKNIR